MGKAALVSDNRSPNGELGLCKLDLSKLKNLRAFRFITLWAFYAVSVPRIKSGAG
jgi:hypothetical protein